MGCFNTILVPCPVCKKKFEAQTKGGSCNLETFEIEDAPADDMTDVNRHAPFQCECGNIFIVNVEFAQPKYKIQSL